jgi:hypothetical protein
MLRKKLEPKIDVLLGEKLRDPGFLSQIVDEFNSNAQTAVSTTVMERAVIEKKLASLENKRQRILEAFFDGTIEKAERHARIVQLDAEVSAFRKILLETMPAVTDMKADEIEQALEPFAEWEFLEREDKRALLTALCPEIRVERYIVKSLMINLVPGNCDNVSQSRVSAARGIPGETQPQLINESEPRGRSFDFQIPTRWEFTKGLRGETMSVTFVSSMQLGFLNRTTGPLALPSGFKCMPPDAAIQAGAGVVPPAAFAVLPAGLQVTLDDANWIVASPEFAIAQQGIAETFFPGPSYSANATTTPGPTVTIVEDSLKGGSKVRKKK